MPPPVPAPERDPSESENSTVYFVQQETRTQRSNQGWSNQEGEASQEPVRRALSRPLPDTAHLRAVAGGLSLIEKIGHELKRIAQVLGSGPQGPVPPKPDAVPSGIWEPTVTQPQVSTHPPIPPRPLEPLVSPVVSPRPPWEVTETTARPGQIRRSARQQRGASPTEWRPQLEGRPRSMASGSYGSFQSISGSNVSSPLNSQFSVAQDVPSHRSVQARAAAICGPKRSGAQGMSGMSARAFQGLARPATQQGAAPKFLWHQREAVDPLDGVILEEAQNIDLRPQSPLRQASARAGQIQVQAQKRQNGAGGPPKAFADALAQAVKDFDGRSPSELNRPQASPLSPRARESSLQRQSARTPEPPWANWPQEEANLTVQSPRETGRPSDFQRDQRGGQAETGQRLVEEHDLRNQHTQQERYQAAASAASAASAATAGSILGASEVIDGPEFQRRHSVATEDSSVAASERSRRRRSRREDDDGQSVSDRSRRRRRRHSEDGTTSERSRRSRRSHRGDEDDASETTSQHSRRRRRRRQEEDGESQSSRRREREEEPEDGQRLERIQEESGSPSSPKESKRSQGAPPPLEARGSQAPESRDAQLPKGKAAEAQLSMSKSCGSTALPSSPGNFSSATTSSRTMPQLQAEARPEEEVLSAAEKRWQDEIDSIRRQAMRYSKGQRLRGPSITEDTMTK